MIEVIIAVVVLGGIAAVAAAVLSRRDQDAPEQAPTWEVPARLDRSDFDRPEAEWLVAVFASSTCLACAATWDKAEVLASDAVVVQKVDSVDEKAIHTRYGVEAVPMTLVVDGDGEVRRSFLGEPTATDLWAAVADLREPGTVPPSCTGDGGHGSAPADRES